MAYAVLEDIQALISKFTISVSSKPTASQAEAIIVDVEAEIDASLSANGVAVPVAAPAWFVTWLGLVSQYGSAAAVLKSMFPDAVGAAETPAYAFWEDRYQKALAGIRNGTMIPPDAVTNAARVAPSTYLTRNPDAEEDLGEIAEPFFKRSKVL